MQREKLKIPIKNSKLWCALLSFTRHSSLVTHLITCHLLLFTLFGCGYSVQTRSELPFDSISIGKIENNTSEPKLQDRLSRSLAETFMQYGCQINPHARYKIEGKITKFEMEPVAEKASAATQYMVIVRADFRLIDTINGSFQTFSIHNPFYVYFSSAGSIQQVLAQKDIALGRALDDLSQEIVRRIIYYELKDFR